MLKSVIENYLESIKEVQLFLPFYQLLETKGFFDIHITHGSSEFGKDLIAKNNQNGQNVQYSFQLKAGNINTNKFRNDVKPQLLEALTNRLSHPSFDKNLPYQVVFVTSGVINSSANIAFQEFNQYVENNLNEQKIVCWEKGQLISSFLDAGINPFFSIHNSPEFIGSFFNFYAKIKNDEIVDSFQIERYTRYWLELDWKEKINRLQVFFETYFFSKLFADNKNYYNSVLVISSLVRFLIQNQIYENYKSEIEQYIQDLLKDFYKELHGIYKNNESLSDVCSGFFSIFEYPKICLRSSELLCLGILLFDEPNKAIDKLLFKILDDEPGVEHPLSDNYAISVLFIAITLFKLKQHNRLKKFLNNVTVWLCDRYSDIGLSQIGSSEQAEKEQLLSEYLSGFEYQHNNSSFIASAILDLCYLIGDKEFYSKIANDLKATNIIIEFYHVLDFSSLFSYTNKNILKCFDSEYSIDFAENYSECIKHERASNNITIREKGLFLIMALLRDRYFPSFILKLI